MAQEFIFKNFSVFAPDGGYLGLVSAADRAAALKIAIAIYGNHFGSDTGVVLG